MAGERRGNPRAAIGVVVITVYLSVFLTSGALMIAFDGAEFCGTCRAGDLVTGALWFLPAVVCLVSGLWLARRVRTGYWGRRPPLPPPPSDEPPPGPLAGDDPYEPSR